MANIPIRNISVTGTPTSDSSIVFDDGQMKRGTVASMADAVRPVASQGEAEAGSDNAKTMTALRVKQSIASEVGVTVQAYSSALGDVSGVNTGDQTITLTGDVTGTGAGSFAATIGATKVTSAMLNSDVFSTAHSWSGTQTFTAPVLGTPASGTLTNATGLPISTGVSGLGTGIATFLATPSSANLRTALTDETGSGAAVFATAPTLSNPVVGTQSPGDNSTKAASTAYVEAAVAGSVAGVSSIDGATGALTTDTTLGISGGVLSVSDAGVEMAKLGTTIYDSSTPEIKLGTTLRADPLLDDDATLTGRSNILIGKNMLTTADDRTTVSIAMGYGTLEDASDVYGATMIGFRNGSKISGSEYATGVGIDCFSFTTTCDASTAIGAHCATYKDQVDYSFIGGSFAAFSEGIVTNSVVIGYIAGSGNIGSPTTTQSYDDCVLIGYSAGNSNFADKSTFIGSRSAYAGTITGTGNTAVGADTLQSVSSGIYNVAVGLAAGNSVTTGNRNTCVGQGAGPNGNYTNTSCLGNNSLATADNHVVLGDSAIASLRCQQTSITALSDERDKKDIEDIRVGLDFINTVRPVRFTWDMRDGAVVGVPEAGIIAQELDAVSKAHGVEWMGLVDSSDPNRLQATPHKLLFPLIKAVQELSAENEDLKQRVLLLEADHD